MSFLLAEILVLLVLAALLGAALAWWWARRRFRDVTAEWSACETIREELARTGEARRAAEAELHRLQGEQRVLSLQLEQEAAFRSSIGARLAALSGTDPGAAPERLAPVLERLAALEARPEPADLEPVLDRLGWLGQRLVPVDLSPLEQRLSQLELAVRGLEVRGGAGLEQRLTALAGSLEAARPTDLAPVNVRLDRIEELLARPPAGPPAPPPAPHRQPGENLLSGPVHGAPDDLKAVRGIGEKLERLLHRLGVYYFWQIADWSRADVRFVDSRLDAFRGRIVRDRWVAQARRLATLPASARPPAPEGVEQPAVDPAQ